ncbi:MAG: lipopolysaccharide biosynthesis protein [Bacteroidota bacterium]
MSWTLAGNAILAGSKWGVLAVLAKLTTTEDVGTFALGLAVAAPVFMLTDLQLRSVQATDAQDEHDFATYFWLRTKSTSLALVTVVAIGVAVRPGEGGVIIGLMALWRAAESMSDVVYGALQKAERMDWVSQSLLVKGPLTLAALWVGLVVTGSVTWAVVGLVLGALATFWAIDLPRARRLGVRFQRDGGRRGEQGQLIRLALPLGVVMMLISLNTNVPRYFVEAWLGTSALGVFSALVYVAISGGMVVTALGQAAAPRLSQHFAAHDHRAFNGLVRRLLLIAAVMGGAGMVVAAVGGTQILTLLYTPEYARHHGLFVGVMGVASILYVATALGYAMTAARAFRQQMPLFAVTVGVSVVVGALAVPAWGLAGAVATMGASASTQVAGAAWVLRRLGADSRVVPALAG